jgi:hypothetical protein
MPKIFFVLCAMSALSVPMTATAFTGNQLLALCEQPNRMSEGYCIGFISGIDEGFRAAEFLYRHLRPDEGHHCRPNGVNAGQLQDIVMRDLRQSPQRRHEPASLLVLDSLRRAFPCR